MIGWLVDNTALLTFLVGAIAVGAAAMWWSSRKKEPALVAAVAVVLLAILWLAGQFFVSDREMVLRTLRSLAGDVESERYESVLRRTSKDFRFQAGQGATFTGTELEHAIKMARRAGKAARITIALSDEKATVAGDSAEMLFNYRVDADNGFSYPASGKATFVREGGEWKLKGFENFVFGTNQPQRIPGL